MSLLKAVIELHYDASLGNLFQLDSVLGKKNTGMQEFDTVARQIVVLLTIWCHNYARGYEQAHQENQSGR